jgi:hypothetical protein
MIFFLPRFLNFKLRHFEEDRSNSSIPVFTFPRFSFPFNQMGIFRVLICLFGIYLFTGIQTLSAQAITRASFNAMADDKKAESVLRWMNQSVEVELSSEAHAALTLVYQGKDQHEALVKKNGLLLKVIENKKLSIDERMCMARFLLDNMDAAWFPLEYVREYNRELEKQFK